MAARQLQFSSFVRRTGNWITTLPRQSPLPATSPRIAVEDTSSHGSRRLSICLLCPRFEPSFFGMEYSLPLFPGDKRAASFPGALPLLAALAPGQHDITLIDENIEPLDFDALSRFDIIGVTGMIVQKRRMREILARLVDAGPLVLRRRALCDRQRNIFRRPLRREVHRRGGRDLAALPERSGDRPAHRAPLRAGDPDRHGKAAMPALRSGRHPPLPDGDDPVQPRLSVSV